MKNLYSLFVKVLSTNETKIVKERETILDVEILYTKDNKSYASHQVTSLTSNEAEQALVDEVGKLAFQIIRSNKSKMAENMRRGMEVLKKKTQV